jgi:DNA-binding response OmpR family regulator
VSIKNVLLVDDAKETYQMVQQGLVGTFFNLVWVKTLSGGRKKISKNAFDFLLLDIGLPDGNGLDFCYEVQRSYPHLPIFLISSNHDLSKKVLGFSVGADDFITKPFNPLELKARMEAQLRKVDFLKRSAEVLKWRDIEIERDQQEVRIYDGKAWKEVELTGLEFKLLTYFAKNSGHVIERSTILEKIWGTCVHVYPRSVDTHVSKLRRKLKPAGDLIESVHGAGYKFDPIR